jgi:hypothetical protein
MEFTKQQLVGFGGAILLLIGVFLPVISAPIVGAISLINNGQGDGSVILILAIITIILVFVNKVELLWIPAGLSGLILVLDFYHMSSRISRMKEEMTSQMQGNMFGGLAEAMMSTVQLQYGWVVLAIGCVLLILAPFIKNEDKHQNS